MAQVHRIRSYSIGDSDVEVSANERTCPIWKVAWIAAYDPGEEQSSSYDVTNKIFIGDDYEHYYLLKRGYCDIDREAYDEMLRIWESTHDPCFVSIESMRKKDFSDRFPIGSALLHAFGRMGMEAHHPRHGLAEMSLLGPTTLHKFGFEDTVSISSDHWDTWGLVWREITKSKSKSSKYQKRIVNCAVRLFRAQSSATGMC